MKWAAAGLRSYSRHGKTETPLYRVWYSMMYRCYCPDAQQFPRYGARGIKVADRWHDFETFVSEIGPRPQGATLERVDNDGPYSPENVRWATRAEQAQNRVTTRRYTHQGKTQSIAAWAREFGVCRQTLRMRLNRGMTLLQAAAAGERTD
ncbi:MAG: hypothetical protein ACK5X3_10200 [Pseudomonadota bacterium]|jgi:ribosomal protein S14